MTSAPRNFRLLALDSESRLPTRKRLLLLQRLGAVLYATLQRDCLMVRGATPDHEQARRPISATAFVDWRAQMHNADCVDAPAMEGARRTLAQTTRLVGRALAAEKFQFRVSFRLYHGWHKGWEPTDGLKAAAEAVGTTDFTPVFGDRVAFSPTVQYGHTLIAALPERQHAGRSIHLPNTLRDQGAPQPTEKMVDTALAADLLAWARQSPSEWALVLAEDDDVVPPLFTAESWIKPHGGRALLLRRRPATQYLKLHGLLRQLP